MIQKIINFRIIDEKLHKIRKNNDFRDFYAPLFIISALKIFFSETKEVLEIILVGSRKIGSGKGGFTVTK